MPWVRLVLVSIVVGASILFGCRGADSPPYTEPDTSDSVAPLSVVAAENALPGTPDWKLQTPALAHEIEGYASLTSVNQGSPISIHVNVASAGRYSYEIFRMGWYAGMGARRLVGPTTLAGAPQPACPMSAEYGTFDCNWAPSFTVLPTEKWISGVYLVRLSTATVPSFQSYVIFTVRQDDREAGLVFQSSVATWQAYNDWPGLVTQTGARPGELPHGKSIYSLLGECCVGGPPTCPASARQCTPRQAAERGALRVSFNRPYGVTRVGSAAHEGLVNNPNSSSGLGAGEFLTNLSSDFFTTAGGWEYDLVRFLEREGYDVAYVTNIDTHQRDSAWLTSRYGAFLSVGHDEYWSRPMRTAVEGARDVGLDLGFFSGNTSYWQTRFVPDATGKPDRWMIAFKNAGQPGDIRARVTYVTGASDSTCPLPEDPSPCPPPENQTRLWAYAGKPVSALDHGRSSEAEMIGIGGPTVLYPPKVASFYSDDIPLLDVGVGPSRWMFEGSSAVDRSRGALGVLPKLLGHESARMDRLGAVLVAGGADVHGDFTYYTAGTPAARVISTGSVQWSWGLDDYDPSCSRPSLANETAQQMTRNILDALSKHVPSHFTEQFRDAFYVKGGRDLDVWDQTGRWIAAPSESVKVEQSSEFDGSGHPIGGLKITPARESPGVRFNGYSTKQTIDFTGKQATIRVHQPTSSNADAAMLLSATMDPDHWFRIILQSGNLSFEVDDGGSSTRTSIPFSASEHRWWRLRYLDADDDAILFETSSDDQVWVTRRSVEVPRWSRSVHLELQAGTFSSTTTAPAIFSSFSLQSAQPAALTDDFVSYAQDSSRWRTSTISGAPGAGCATQGGGELEIRMPARQKRPFRTAKDGYSWLDVPSFTGYVSRDSWDLTNKTATVEAFQSPDEVDASTYFGIGIDHQNWLRIVREDASLSFEASTAGSISKTSTRFSNTDHRWWRLQHDAVTKVLSFQTSPNGDVWTTMKRVAAPHWLTRSKIELQSGTKKSTTLSTPAKFRSFSIH